MALGSEDFAREARAAADVEEEGGPVEVEELERAVGHVGLDGEDTGGGGVFAGFGGIVKEVGGEDVFGTGHGCGCVGWLVGGVCMEWGCIGIGKVSGSA